MTELPLVYNLIDPNTGETYKAGNLKRQHNIPIGALVEVKYDHWFGDGACEKVHARLWVVAHTRDCDGTPLYSLSRWDDPQFAREMREMVNGFVEESLTVVEVTPEVRRGVGALGWDEEATGAETVTPEDDGSR